MPIEVPSVLVFIRLGYVEIRLNQWAGERIELISEIIINSVAF